MFTSTHQLAINAVKAQPVISLLMILLLACLSACAGGGSGLDGTSWELVDLDGSSPAAGSTLTIAFTESGAGGSAGCNSYGGSYRVDGDAITFNGITSTLMACMEPGWMEQEAAFLSLLQDARSFTVKDGSLTITTEDGAALTFKRQ